VTAMRKPAWTINYKTPVGVGSGTASGDTRDEAIDNLKKRHAFWHPGAIRVTDARKIERAE
jgi:hypothetical protein